MSLAVGNKKPVEYQSEADQSPISKEKLVKIAPKSKKARKMSTEKQAELEREVQALLAQQG